MAKSMCADSCTPDARAREVGNGEKHVSGQLHPRYKGKGGGEWRKACPSGLVHHRLRWTEGGQELKNEGRGRTEAGMLYQSARVSPCTTFQSGPPTQLSA
eukprot:365010-Chlamydomonas_euryale.AAC.4